MVTEAEWKLAGEVEPSVALTPIPQHDAIIANLKLEGEKFLDYAKRAEVTDLATAKDATNDITLIRTTVKLLEEKRKAYKAPLLEAGRELDRYFNEIAEPFKGADKCYSDKVLAYHKEEERKRQEIERLNKLAEEKARIEKEIAERKAREEREAWEKEQREARLIAEALNEAPPEPPPPPPPAPVVEAPKTIEVPDQQKHVRAEAGTLGFTWVLDKEKVEAALLAGVQEIPGVHIWFEPKYKVLDLKRVPEEYKRQSTRVTR
jgi:hypothetical protein